MPINVSKMPEKNKPRLIVCQHGARRGYAVPRMLEEAGMLEALYTDSCEYSNLGRLAKVVGPLSSGSINRLAGRRIKGVPKGKIFATDVPTYKCIIKKRGKSKINDYLLSHESMNNQMIRFGTRNADAIYCFEGENLGYIRYAKEQGLKIYLDVCINPLTEKILREERRKYEKEISFNVIDEYAEFRMNYFISQSSVSDILLCPSEFVASGVKELIPEYESKISICPYGVNKNSKSLRGIPVKGRFFWAGRDWIRKGLHYLAQAANELKQKYPDMQFRAAGITDPKVTQMEQFKHITFLGSLNKEQMKEEYMSADAFVFPTLSEGMAGVVIDAIVAGCPVITTKSAGIDAIENGENGIIVSEGNTEDLCVAIERVYCDREFRNIMAANAIELAKQYTNDIYKDLLINILRKF